jgi:hypothetical protein
MSERVEVVGSVIAVIEAVAVALLMSALTRKEIFYEMGQGLTATSIKVTLDR